MRVLRVLPSAIPNSARLTPLAANIRWLDLGGTQVTDSGVPTLMQMTNLTRLHLERTKLTDAGLAKLAALNELEYLNLYGTEISDAGIENLQVLPNSGSFTCGERK